MFERIANKCTHRPLWCRACRKKWCIRWIRRTTMTLRGDQIYHALWD